MFSESLTRAWKSVALEAETETARSGFPRVQANDDAGSELPDEALEHVAGGRSAAWVEDFLTMRAATA